MFCSGCGGDYEDPGVFGYEDDNISDEQQEAAMTVLLSAIRKQGKVMDDGRELVRQFLDNCKQSPNSVMTALRKSLEL